MKFFHLVLAITLFFLLTAFHSSTRMTMNMSLSGKTAYNGYYLTSGTDAYVEAGGAYYIVP